MRNGTSSVLPHDRLNQLTRGFERPTLNPVACGVADDLAKYLDGLRANTCRLNANPASLDHALASGHRRESGPLVPAILGQHDGVKQIPTDRPVMSGLGSNPGELNAHHDPCNCPKVVPGYRRMTTGPKSRLENCLCRGPKRTWGLGRHIRPFRTLGVIRDENGLVLNNASKGD